MEKWDKSRAAFIKHSKLPFLLCASACSPTECQLINAHFMFDLSHANMLPNLLRYRNSRSHSFASCSIKGFHFIVSKVCVVFHFFRPKLHPTPILVTLCRNRLELRSVSSRCSFSGNITPQQHNRFPWLVVSSSQAQLSGYYVTH